MRAGRSADLVSVVLPVADREDVIGDAVSSVLAQTHAELELIVVDDGSGDGTVEVVRSFGDDRVRVISLPERGGAPTARNTGIAAADGRYLAFQDSADVWHPRKLALPLAAMQRAQPELRMVAVGCDWRLLGRDLATGDAPPALHVATRRHVLAGALRGLGTPMLVVDRSRAAPDAGFDPGFPALQDRDFLLSCLGPGGQVGIVDRPLVSVRRGRADHIASPGRAQLGNIRYVQKYASELAELPRVRDWYLYCAMREAIRAGDRTAAARYLASFGSLRRMVASVPEFLLAQVLGETGLKIASRGRLRPDWDQRVADQVSIDL